MTKTNKNIPIEPGGPTQVDLPSDTSRLHTTNSYRVFIPTYGRVGKQKTLGYLNHEGFTDVTLICRPEEESKLRRKYKRGIADTLVVDKPGVSAARQAAVELCQTEKIDVAVMLDDDLQFGQRVSNWEFEAYSRALKPLTGDVYRGLSWLADMCSPAIPMTSLAARSMNQNHKEPYVKWNYRCMMAFAVHVPTLEQEAIRFDDFYYWEDFHVVLSLLELGYPNLVNMRSCIGSETNSHGGVIRNVDRMMEEVTRLVETHAPNVKMRMKEVSDGSRAKGMIEVPDVRVQWKRSYRSRIQRV